MRKLSLSKKNKQRLALLILGLITIAAIVPYFYGVLSPSSSEIMSNFNVLGFTTSGQIFVEQAISQSFVFFENNFTVTIPCDDSIINSLQVVGSNQQASPATFNTVLFNCSGDIDISASNVSLMQYQVINSNETAQLSFMNNNVTTLLLDSTYPNTEVSFINMQPNSEGMTLSDGNPVSSIFLTFAASNSTDGSLSVEGNGNNFSVPLNNDYVGILLNVTTPINRSYDATINGDVNSVNLNDWSMIKLSFPLSYKNSDITALGATGALAYGNKQLTAEGNQNFVFSDIHGVAYLTPTSDFFFYRMILNGDVSSINCVSGNTSTDITEITLLDAPNPLPYLAFAILTALFLLWFTRKIAYVVLPSMLVFFVFSLLWSVETQQPLWLQNFLGYAPLFVTTITFLLDYSRKQNPKAA
jgi:hypothetical protein